MRVGNSVYGPRAAAKGFVKFVCLVCFSGVSFVPSVGAPGVVLGAKDRRGGGALSRIAGLDIPPEIRGVAGRSQKSDRQGGQRMVDWMMNGERDVVLHP